jgi:hypothetical protein
MKSSIREKLKQKGVIMADEALAVQERNAEIEVPQVHLVARNPNEMALAKTSLTLFLRQKVQQCDAESNELGDAAGVASENGWKFDTLAKYSKLAMQRGDFYRKALAAVEAGFTIVPNFPIDLFAVRVKRSHPKPQRGTSVYSQGNAMQGVHAEEPQILSPGEGRYVNPLQLGRTGDYKDKNSKGEEITKYFFNTTDFQDIAFPIEAAREEVMSATAEAMALKVFDAIGICPQTRNGDPLIIGQILSHKKNHSQKTISFLIAWHLDLRTL